MANPCLLNWKHQTRCWKYRYLSRAASLNPSPVHSSAGKTTINILSKGFSPGLCVALSVALFINWLCLFHESILFNVWITLHLRNKLQITKPPLRAGDLDSGQFYVGRYHTGHLYITLFLYFLPARLDFQRKIIGAKGVNVYKFFSFTLFR